MSSVINTEHVAWYLRLMAALLDGMLVACLGNILILIIFFSIQSMTGRPWITIDDIAGWFVLLWLLFHNAMYFLCAIFEFSIPVFAGMVLLLLITFSRDPIVRNNMILDATSSLYLCILL